MWEYVGVEDFERHSVKALAMMENEGRVRDITARALEDFMDEGWPLPLSKGILCDLVSFLLRSLYLLSVSVSDDCSLCRRLGL